MHKAEDVEPKEWCCSLSDKCFLYLAARPIDNCFNYMPPFLGESVFNTELMTLFDYCETNYTSVERYAKQIRNPQLCLPSTLYLCVLNCYGDKKKYGE